ncbi:MAG: hypothetical protein ACLQQ4_01235 [Bacteroidia bacterium]
MNIEQGILNVEVNSPKIAISQQLLVDSFISKFIIQCSIFDIPFQNK